MHEENVDLVVLGASLSHCLLAARLKKESPEKSVLLVDSAETYGHDYPMTSVDDDACDPQPIGLDAMARPFLAAESWIDWVQLLNMQEYFTFLQVKNFLFVQQLTGESNSQLIIQKVIMEFIVVGFRLISW